MYTTRSGNTACFPRPARSRSYDNAMAEKRQRRVQDRAGVAAQAIRRPGRARIGDVPVGSRGGTRSVSTSRWAAGHRNRSKPSIMQTKRHKPSHNKRGTEIRPRRQPHRARHAPLRRTRHTPTTTKNLTHENSRSLSILQFHYKGHITAYARRRAYACTTPATSRTRR